jgi:catechol 2,3-dioxygenase-like lactoylglutathione lyase family enzyme
MGLAADQEVHMEIACLRLFCDDIGETTRFYRDILGFAVMKELQPARDVKLALIERQGMRIELLERVGAPKVAFQDFTSTLGFHTDSIEKEYERMVGAGVRLKSKLRNLGPKTRVFEVFDPSGFGIFFAQDEP